VFPLDRTRDVRVVDEGFAVVVVVVVVVDVVVVDVVVVLGVGVVVEVVVETTFTSGSSVFR